ncbi:MAG: peptidoglycan editing factor PgeF [Candidatus Omnitrophota bacterium]|jgi:hypothetical protein
MRAYDFIQEEEYDLFSDLLRGELVCGFSNRSHRNMSFVYGNGREKACLNRNEFLIRLGIDYQSLVATKQVHASRIRYVDSWDKGSGALSYQTSVMDTDALITDYRNVPLAILSADCQVVFLYDPCASAIGLVHSGWRGTQERIVVQTVQAMKEKFNTRPQDLYAGLGPSIRACCYEVGVEFKDSFPDDIIEKGSRYYLDLAEINRRQLVRSGLRDINIFDNGSCTSCQNDRYFSYRREGASCGRMMAVLMLK